MTYNSITPKPQRIYSIDMLKGICMLFMLIDHWRDMLSRMAKDTLGIENPLPVNANHLENFDTAVFWLRCTSGFIVPVTFLFLAGAGSYLWQTRRGIDASLFKYLVSRGAMLAIVNCLLFFSSPFSQGGSITLHVLWPTGIGMIILGCIYKLPKYILWTVAFICIAGQNYFETLTFSSSLLNTIWTFAFINAPIPLPWGAELYNLWPIMPWFGILLLGYLCAPIFSLKEKSYSSWIKLGISCLAVFLFLRLTGIYGDPSLWQVHDSLLKTLGDIIAINKYPPSLQFILYGLSATFFLLALLERFQFTNRMLLVLGSSPLFFYIVHLTFLRGIKFIILRLPSQLLENVNSLLFSFAGLIFSSVIIALFLWFFCELYKIIMKRYKKFKLTNN